VSERMTITREALYERRRALLFWAVAVAAVSLLYGAFAPMMQDQAEQMDQFLEAMPEGMVTALGYDQMDSAAGYLGATVYGLLGPTLLLIFAVATGARLIAGQEEDGTLELELTHPVSRTAVLAQRLLALWLAVAALVVVVSLVTALLVMGLDLEVGWNEMAAAGVGLLLLAMAFGALALAVGAATGRRSAALGVAAALVVLGFIANAVAPLIEGGGWLTAISPWSWYTEESPLVHGWDARGFLLLAALAAGSVLAGLLGYRRRDLGV
jgi:ABC-2 type transport system permease protein